MDRHALSSHGRRQGRRLRLRDAAGARLLRPRPRRAVRSAPLPARLASCTAARSAISASCSRARARSPRRSPATSSCSSYGRCFAHGGIVTQRRAADHRPRLSRRRGWSSRRSSRTTSNFSSALRAGAASPVTGALDMGWFRGKKRGQRPTTPACNCKPRSARCRSRSSGGRPRSRQRHLVQQLPDPHAGSGGGKGGLFGAGSTGLHLQRRPHHGARAKGRSPASATSGATNRPTRSPSSACRFFNGSTPQATWGYLDVGLSARSARLSGHGLSSARRITSSAPTPTSATTISRSSACSPEPGSTASTPTRRR